jgi:hypothetical protein
MSNPRIIPVDITRPGGAPPTAGPPSWLATWRDWLLLRRHAADPMQRYQPATIPVVIPQIWQPGSAETPQIWQPGSAETQQIWQPGSAGTPQTWQPGSAGTPQTWQTPAEYQQPWQPAPEYWQNVQYPPPDSQNYWAPQAPPARPPPVFNRHLPPYNPYSQPAGF